MKVKFMPMDVEHEIEFNETVLHLAQRKDIHIQSICKGIPSCTECRVCITEGEHHVLPPSSKELSLIGTAHYIDQSRLSCQLRCFGDVIVDLSEQVEKQGRVAKSPQGPASRKEGEESLAVKGNIIEEYHEDDDKSLTKELNITKGPNNDFYNDVKTTKKKTKRKRNRNRNKSRSRSAGDGNSSGGSGSQAQASGGTKSTDGDKKSSDSNRKRRRRPRNRKPRENREN